MAKTQPETSRRSVYSMMAPRKAGWFVCKKFRGCCVKDESLGQPFHETLPDCNLQPGDKRVEEPLRSAACACSLGMGEARPRFVHRKPN